jgi:hypothetical protein
VQRPVAAESALLVKEEVAVEAARAPAVAVKAAVATAAPNC